MGNNVLENVLAKYFKTPHNCFGSGLNKFINCVAVQYVYSRDPEPYILPSNVGFPIGDPEDNINEGYTMLQVHYNNPLHDKVIFDNSTGVKIFWTEKLRQDNAGCLVLGDKMAKFSPILNQKDGKLAHRQSICHSEATNHALSSDPAEYQQSQFGNQYASSISVFASFAHMHVYGRKYVTNHFDKNRNFLGTRNRIDWWDGGFQKFQFQAHLGGKNNPSEFIINPGDSIYSHCYYDVSATDIVNFGPASLNEMCMEFFLYYPKVPNFNACGWTPNRDFGSKAGGSYHSTLGIFSGNSQYKGVVGVFAQNFDGSNTTNPLLIDPMRYISLSFSLPLSQYN